ncbi:Protein MCM10 [Gossypium australe]|uniref:Protein MCM10 n=1 Tax=Gossypium australe TaxID=47621 RepID=A0A5B6WGH4_9ROSI|nr:Protein MCM10 [Gossypium australe]
MNECLTQYIRTNPAVQQPPHPSVPHLIRIVPQGINPLRLNKPPVDKIRKHGAEEFRATVNDDPERVEFWLENTIRRHCVLVVQYLISIVSRERVTWDFFQVKFRKKYISRRFIDKKRKEFLELKQGRMSVTEYGEFVQLSEYARECVSSEAIMCKRFEDGLNKEIRVLVGILKMKEFVPKSFVKRKEKSILRLEIQERDL